MNDSPTIVQTMAELQDGSSEGQLVGGRGAVEEHHHRGSYHRGSSTSSSSSASPAARNTMQTIAGVMGNVLEWRVL